MPRAPKKCGYRDCEERTTSSYCTTHAAARQSRANTTQRGYGATHQRARAVWAPTVAAGIVTCWRCGEPITPTDTWHLGHDDNNRSITRGPEHARRCNLRTAGQRTRNPGRPTPTPGQPR